MKKKKSKLIWVILVLIIVLVGIVAIYINQDAVATTDTSSSTTKEVQVSTQTITKTLTSSGEISSLETETLSLNTYRYFKEIYVEENEFISKGGKILKYTNGTYLTAPYDCVITKISVPEDSGDKCTSQNYVEVQTTETLLMSLSIDEEDIGKVAIGQEVEITANAYEDKTYTGTITKINQIGTYASNGSSFTATVQFDNDGDIKIGMSASATVTLEKVENVIAVPIEAVQTKNNEKYVIVKKADGATENVTIETGISNDAYVEIKSGLTGNETIQMTVETSSKTNGQNSQMGGFGQQGEKFNKEERMQQGGTMPSMPATGGIQGQ